jgi:hypothetical protein
MIAMARYVLGVARHRRTRSRQERYLPTHAAGSDASLQSKQLQSPFGLHCLEA